jgi:hypothetical protein
MGEVPTSIGTMDSYLVFETGNVMRQYGLTLRTIGAFVNVRPRHLAAVGSQAIISVIQYSSKLLKTKCFESLQPPELNPITGLHHAIQSVTTGIKFARLEINTRQSVDASHFIYVTSRIIEATSRESIVLISI